MSETTRITRQCTINELNPVLSTALRAHIAQYHLDDLETDILMCCETSSTQQKKGLFGGMEKAVSVVFVTPKWLAWAESLNNKIAEVNSALLTRIDIRDFAGSAMDAIAPDTGMNVSGRYTNAVKTGQAFIGIGADEVGVKFRQVLHEAMQKATNKKLA